MSADGSLPQEPHKILKPIHSSSISDPPPATGAQFTNLSPRAQRRPGRRVLSHKQSCQRTRVRGVGFPTNLPVTYDNPVFRRQGNLSSIVRRVAFHDTRRHPPDSHSGACHPINAPAYALMRIISNASHVTAVPVASLLPLDGQSLASFLRRDFRVSCLDLRSLENRCKLLLDNGMRPNRRLCAVMRITALEAHRRPRFRA